MSKRFEGRKYKGQVMFEHGRGPRLGILVVNLGTPDKPTPAAVRRYLAEFLSDSRSPLMAFSSALADKLDTEMKRRIPGKCSVVLAMRYGQPSIQQGLEKLQSEGAERIMILPLYPQYSGATTGTVADAVFANLSRWRWVPELRMLGAYHDDPHFIHALSESIREHVRDHGQGDRLLISFHGMPKRTLLAGDPYFCHCHKTARLLAAALDLQGDQCEMAFQSRFGAAEWLQPYVAERLVQLPLEGVKHLTVVCPGFAADCLETLDEIAAEGRDAFLDAGGERFEYIPALNASAQHVSYMADRLVRHAAGWPELDQDFDLALQQESLSASRQYALAKGGN